MRVVTPSYHEKGDCFVKGEAMNRKLVAALAWGLTVLGLQGCASFSAVDASPGAGAGASSTTQGSASTNFGSATPPRFGPQMP